MTLLDLTYFSAYEAQFGFRVDFELLHGAKMIKDSVY